MAESAGTTRRPRPAPQHWGQTRVRPGQTGVRPRSERGQTGVRPGSRRGSDTGTDQGLTPWLAEYLQRRIHVTAWLLDHWNAPPPEHDSVVDAAQAHETLRSLERIFVEVERRHPTSAARLGWANGPLADRSSAPPFTTAVDWPNEFETTLPVRGGLGLFLTEVLSNAMRHGAAGSSPHVAIQCDRVRKELIFSVENRRRTTFPGRRASMADCHCCRAWRACSAGRTSAPRRMTY